MPRHTATRLAGVLVAIVASALVGCTRSARRPADPGRCQNRAAADDRSPDKTWRATLDAAIKRFGAGDRSRAVAEARRALALAERTFKGCDRRIVRSQLILSSMLLQTGGMAEAATLANRANRCAEKLLVAARSRVATTLKFLGTIHLLKRDFNAAESVYKRAVAISGAAVGPDHPETAKHLGNLAGVLIQKREFAQARRLLDRAMKIWAAQPKPHPVYTVQAMTNLADLLMETGDAKAALRLYADALSIQEKAFGANSPKLANLLKAYARALRRAGKDSDAAKLEKRLPH